MTCTFAVSAPGPAIEHGAAALHGVLRPLLPLTARLRLCAAAHRLGVACLQHYLAMAVHLEREMGPSRPPDG